MDPDPSRPRVATLVITPSSDTLLALADTRLFEVTAFDQFGSELPAPGVLWESSDPDVVQVHPDGLVVARRNGTGFIAATAESVSDTALVLVAQRATRVEAVLDRDTLAAIGDTVRAAAKAYDSHGYMLGKGSVHWGSSDKTVAVVSSTGVITAVGNGTTYINATADDGSDSVQVTVRQQPYRLTVSPPQPSLRALGETLQLTAAAFDSQGNAMPVAHIEWSTTTANVLSVSATGLVTAVANGVGFVTAAVDDQVDTVSIQVDQVAVALDLTPDRDTLDALGETLYLEWAAYDARGNPVSDAPNGWDASDGRIVDVQDGAVTALENGEVWLSARLDRAADTIHLVVQQTPVAMSISPTSSTVLEGDTMHLAVTLRDRNDSLIAVDGVEWSPSDSDIAFVDQNGILYAFTLGVVDVTARVAGFTDVRTVTVAPLFSAFGLNFSPFLDGQNPSSIVTEQQIRDRIEIIAPYTEWIRTFGCSGGLSTAGAVARELGLMVAMGAWLGPDSASNEAEMACLIQRANAGEVDLAVVGGEVLYRGDLSEDELIHYIERVQEALPNTPVTYNDTHDQLLAHPRVIDAVDVVLANFYPFWDGTPIGDAMIELDISYQILQAASGEKTVMVGEAGWPTCGTTILDARPTPSNGARFFYEFQEWTAHNNVPSFYFSAFDEAWKTVNEGPQGACWGLWDSRGEMKLPKPVTD